jgi:hypothetical protein
LFNSRNNKLNLFSYKGSKLETSKCFKWLSPNIKNKKFLLNAFFEFLFLIKQKELICLFGNQTSKLVLAV